MSEQKDYYGTKRVTAWPESRIEAGNPNVGAQREGYAVKYADGYQSWSPKAVFEAAYKPVTAMDFSGALQAIKDGYIVSRGGPEISMRNHGFWALDGRDLLADDWSIVGK